MDYRGHHIGRIVRERARTSPDVPVVTISPDGAEPGAPGVPITYAELDDRTEVMAAALTRAGVTKGDRAAVMLANGPSFVHSWIGMAKAGVVEVPLHTASRGDGLRHALGLTGASLAVVDERALDRIGEVADDLPSLRTLVVCGDADDLPGRVGGADVVSMADFVDGVRPVSYTHLTLPTIYSV